MGIKGYGEKAGECDCDKDCSAVIEWQNGLWAKWTTFTPLTYKLMTWQKNEFCSITVQNSSILSYSLTPGPMGLFLSDLAEGRNCGDISDWCCTTNSDIAIRVSVYRTHFRFLCTLGVTQFLT